MFYKTLNFLFFLLLVCFLSSCEKKLTKLERACAKSNEKEKCINNKEFFVNYYLNTRFKRHEDEKIEKINEINKFSNQWFGINKTTKPLLEAKSSESFIFGYGFLPLKDKEFEKALKITKNNHLIKGYIMYHEDTDDNGNTEEYFYILSHDIYELSIANSFNKRLKVSRYGFGSRIQEWLAEKCGSFFYTDPFCKGEFIISAEIKENKYSNFKNIVYFLENFKFSYNDVDEVKKEYEKKAQRRALNIFKDHHK